MVIKSISSTNAQNNFGKVLDDITQNSIRYIVKRRGTAQVIILSFDDLTRLLDDEHERQRMYTVLRELRPSYQLGQVLESQKE
jgi:PHD/YefM family antitoxin component YafN of YafNO toxin-antitoxin module